MTALICFIIIILTSWSVSKAGGKHGYIQLYIGQYPVWVRQLLTGPWSLYEREVEIEEYVGVGPEGIIKENIKTKRYYLSTVQGLKELTPINFQSVFLELTPADPAFQRAQKKIGLAYDQIPTLVKQYNEWSTVSHYSSK